MTEQVSALREEDELLDNDWSWDVECCADVIARLDRLKCMKLSRAELYEELIQLMLELEVHWRGLTPERQQACAKEVREVLRECEALKTRMEAWAEKVAVDKTKRGEDFHCDKWGFMHDVPPRRARR